MPQLENDIRPPHYDIGQGAGKYKITRTILDGDGKPVDLTGYTAWFQLYRIDVSPATAAIDASAGAANATIETPVTAGKVSYTFTVAQLQTPGDYAWEFLLRKGSAGDYTYLVDPSGLRGTAKIWKSLATVLQP